MFEHKNKVHIISEFIFNRRYPIVVGADITRGVLRLNDTLIINGDELVLGTVTKMEYEHEELEEAHIGEHVCITISINEDVHELLRVAGLPNNISDLIVYAESNS